MKIFKFSSIAVLALLMMTAFMPELSAKHHHRSHRSTFTSFGLNLNFNPIPQQRVYQTTTYVTQPVDTYIPPAPVYSQPVSYYSSDRVYYPVYSENVVVRRPASPRVVVQPQFSYWNY